MTCSSQLFITKVDNNREISMENINPPSPLVVRTSHRGTMGTYRFNGSPT